MNMLGGMDQRAFIRDIWQQRCHVFRQVLCNDEDLVDGDELAALACDTQVESRLVFCDTQETQWHTEHGPFPEERFEDLPPSHWTLMVQSVDQWLPPMHDLLTAFNFLPRWRLDDILATYACDGGGVGPHFDYYDVFLIQAQGRRRWRIGQYCDSNTLLQANTDLKLIDNFEACEEFILEAGDMLYIPPRWAHWGSAIGDDCITLSVGFRAPSAADLYEALGLPIKDDNEDHRYRDTAASIATDPYCINDAAIAHATALLEGLHTNDAARALAQHVTEARNLNIIEVEDNTPNKTELAALIASETELNINVDAACRCAYVLQGENADLYINGIAIRVSAAFAKAFCKQRIACSLLHDEAAQGLMLECLENGYIYLDLHQ